jgi:hypothetical protein
MYSEMTYFNGVAEKVEDLGVNCVVLTVSAGSLLIIQLRTKEQLSKPRA